MSELNNIPKHWQVKKLGEVCQIQTGKFDANHAKERGKFRFYTCAFEHMYCDTNRFSGECLILPGNGANVGEVFYFNGEFDAYQRTYVINDIKTNPKYLYYHMLCYWKKRNQDKQFGSATNYIRIGNFNDYIVFFPPLPEQLAIVSKIEELLSDLENGKQQLLTAQQQLKVYRQSLLKAAFEGRLTNKEVKEGELPEGWKWVTVGDVCSSVEYGSAIKSKENGKVPVLRMGNIQNGRFDWRDLVYTDDDAEIQKYLLKKNDVLFNRTNSAELVGKTAIYKGERPAIFAGYLIRINRIEALIDADYLTYYLNTHAAKQYGNTVRSFGVNQSNINGTKLKTYPVPLPSLSQQHQIVEILESKLTICDKIAETISQSLQQADTLKQSILKKAFEGKLV